MQLKGPLRICIPNEIGPALLGAVVADFACQHPELEISCVTNLSGFESLREDLDLAVIVSRGQMDDSDYIARHLLTIPCTIVAAPASFSGMAPLLGYSNLKNYPALQR